MSFVAGAALLCVSARAQVPLDNYDAAINNDIATGLTPVATLTSAITLTGAAGSAFDFGATTGDATIEFILEGDPSYGVSANLAVGSNDASSLRYEVWDNTGELGFTLSRVADYQFSPGAASPKKPTHVAYVWDPVTLVMTLYVNGNLAGTTAGVDPAFALPTGAGFLGANKDGSEGMVGTIHRVTVYDNALDAATLRRHADAFGGDVLQALNGYDATIATDAGAGQTPVAQQTSTVILPAAGKTPFDFGATSGDVTMEFILKGDPSANDSAFLAVGENSKSSLRFEVWQNTGQFGFTQGGVADYPFSPGVSSAQKPTHVTYAWNATSLTMKLYINGLLAGTTTAVDPGFAMPLGLGSLGANTGGGERMVGTIYRVTVYDDLLTDAAILRHAKGFTDVLRPPAITAFTAASTHISAGGSTTLSWTATQFKTLTLNGTDVTAQTSLTVSPAVSTKYLLVALNDVGTAESKLTVYVDPKLSEYDAAITADTLAGLTPAAVLTNAVTFTGSGGSPFDFGAVSGSAAIEFIVEGDPAAAVSSFLAVGEVHKSNLRYAQYADTLQYGFTQLTVEDYLFTPRVPASAWPTHLTYVWDVDNTTMSLYVNGTLAGSATGIPADYVLPSGQGFLGSNPDGGEALVGTIFRVTVYDDAPSETVIKRHADAFLGLNSPALKAYDSSVTDGAAPSVARLLAPMSLSGNGGVPFDFGAATGDATVEFLVEGNPDANNSAFLGVGKNSANSFRYEVWDNTGEVGFTLGGVADYQFTPGVPSPKSATLIAYVWTPDTATMKLFVNGALAGTTTNVDAAFEIPADLGRLGSNTDGSEAMVGTIHRVTVYDEVLSPETLLRHARAFANITTRPTLTLTLVKNLPTLQLSEGIAGRHYQVEYRATLGSTRKWETLVDIPALVGTTVQVTDPSPVTGSVQGYYRAIEVP